MRLLITRPAPDALSLEAALEKRDIEATLEPLLSVSFDDGEAVDLEGAQALIATSRNALRALEGRPVLVEAQGLPLFAVGKATSAQARSVGFEVVVTGAGTASALVAQIVSVLEPAAGLIVHLAGDTLAGNIKSELEAHGFRVRAPVVYRMRAATALSEDTIEQLAMSEIDGVILLSPRTASIYADLIRRHGLGSVARGLVHFCLSEAVAKRLQPLGSVKAEVAAAPRLEEVLALIEAAAAQSQP
jgi:uroporphyrinogen-III synthase